jgi:hypothetical protein
MSGTRPKYKNNVLTVRYVEMAKTSQMRGDRKFTHSPRWFGYGKSQ